MPATILGDITLTKQTGTMLTLSTDGKYVNSDVGFELGVRSAVAISTASADASIESDASGRNISGSVGAKADTAPSTGYYLKVGASASGSTSVTTSGWLESGSLGPATASESKYFPVDAATATVSGTNTVTPSASVSGTNITLSNTNNGISVTATGGGSASATATATGNQAGYVPSNGTLGSETIAASSTTTSASSYISGVTLGIPATGTNTFAITLPNGNSTITLTFTVDTNGNWSIE